MSIKREKAAYKRLKERNEDLYKNFQSSFSQEIAIGEPEAGVSRIQLLEKMVHTMNSDIISSNLKYVGSMIESLDEEGAIESKKENS